MPTYSYLCEACKREFEREQRISDPPIKKCPNCGKQKARRMINSANFILKGGGWYSDGYGSSKSGSGAKTSGKAGDKAEASSSSSESSAPAAAPASSASTDTASTSSSPSTKPASTSAKSTD